MQNNVLEVKNLTKKFGPSVDGFTAVDNISFSLKEGEILGLTFPKCFRRKKMCSSLREKVREEDVKSRKI